MSLHFCVFSYNRGRFLQNCVASIELCAPGYPITVYDDGSDDNETQQVLATIGERHSVVLPSRPVGNAKHGGLYANMQRALDAQAAGTIVCFIQDDMQLVRRVDAAEVESIRAHFAAQRPAALLHPAFLKGSNRAADRTEVRYDPTAGGYRSARYRRSAGMHYSDILLASVDQLRELGWRFLPRESANEQQASTLMPPMLHMLHPFAAWLPAVPAWRGRTQTLGLRLAQRWNHCGFHPFNILTETQRSQLMQRDPAVLPVAEDFLVTRGDKVPTPWVYQPLQGHRVLKLLDSVERRLRSYRALSHN